MTARCGDTKNTDTEGLMGLFTALSTVEPGIWRVSEWHGCEQSHWAAQVLLDVIKDIEPDTALDATVSILLQWI